MLCDCLSLVMFPSQSLVLNLFERTKSLTVIRWEIGPLLRPFPTGQGWNVNREPAYPVLCKQPTIGASSNRAG